VERWEIGQSGTSWKNLEDPLALFQSTPTGIALADGVLYAQSVNTTFSTTVRTLSPGDAEPSIGMWSMMDEDDQQFTGSPQALKVSAGSSMLWAADQATPRLYSFTDTLFADGPTIAGPADMFEVKINHVSGAPFDTSFTWERPSKATVYDLNIALDSDFDEKIVNVRVPSTGTTTSSTPSHVVDGPDLDPGTTYYWRVRANFAGPVRSPWSETRMFTVAELPEAVAPVTVTQQPPPVISVPPQPPISIPAPEITLPPQPPPTSIVIPPAPAPAPAVPAWALYAIIVIGAVLVIALIVLIMRTRRPM
jgi:hypothetical protein